MLAVFSSFFMSLAITMALIPPLVRLAERLHVMDIPNERKVHKTAIPRVGGIAMAIGASLPLIVWLPPDRQKIGYLCGVAVLLLFGFWDDRKNIDYRLKFLGQLLAVSIIVLWGGLQIKHLPFFEIDVLPAYVGIPLTMFALVGVTNAINLADGLDGLAAGMMLLSLSMIALMAHLAGSTLLLLATVAVIGGVLGFLRFNTYPARVFMGDAGSQFLGFSAGLLVIVLTQEANSALSPALPLMILGLPIIDTAMVMGQRIYEGRSPFSSDCNHIHHKLLVLGFHHYGAVFIIYLLQAILVLSGFFFRFESDFFILSLYALVCVNVLAFLHLATVTGWRFRPHPTAMLASFLPKSFEWLFSGQRLLKIAFNFALISITAFFLVGVVFVEKVPKDIAIVAWSLLVGVLLVLHFNRRGNAFNIVEKAVAYITCAFVVYLIQATPGMLTHYTLYRDISLATLAVAVAIGFRFSKDKFRITPLDFLVIFITLTVPNLPGLNLSEGHLSASIVMLVVLFYGIELVYNNVKQRWNLMSFAICTTLALLGLRGS